MAKKKYRKMSTPAVQDQKKSAANTPAGKTKADTDSANNSQPAKKNQPAKTSSQVSRNKAQSGSKSARKNQPAKAASKRAMKAEMANRGDGYLVHMSHAPRIDEESLGFQLIPAAIFTAVTILIVRQYNYFRDMSSYYWSNDPGGAPGQPNLVEFFSHYKLLCIEISAILVILMLLYRVITQQFAIKRTNLYIPLAIYAFFVFLSFLFSSDKEIAWGGWNDRFEGTAAILCYVLLIFYIINSINTERNIKWIIYPLVGTTILLSLLGLTQATGHDFFQTTFGQKLIVPNHQYADGTFPWDLIDEKEAAGEKFLKFTFQENQIYQTVYNINYVSFYLTLLIPIYGMLFVREHKTLKKILWGAMLFTTVFNLFGSVSSGGYMGMTMVIIFMIVMLNKRIIKWWKSTALILLIVVVAGASSIGVVSHYGGGYWYDELTSALHGAVNKDKTITGDSDVKADTPGNTHVDNADLSEDDATGDNPGASGSKIDYFSTEGNTLTVSLDGNIFNMTMSAESGLSFTDEKGNAITSNQNQETGVITLSDDRFKVLDFMPTKDEQESQYVVLQLRGETQTWPFMLTGISKDEIAYRNDLGNVTGLFEVPHLGFKNRLSFGSGRGYIWSRSFPLFKNTIFVGHGADTYCVYFPHNDYVGKYNANWNINMIVDKPHNMYIGGVVGTGLISMLALLAFFLLYFIQSIKLYWREKFDSFAACFGAGVMFGVFGFLVSGLVDDSTLSTMPMFYGLLATGIAINIMLKRKREAED